MAWSPSPSWFDFVPPTTNTNTNTNTNLFFQVWEDGGGGKVVLWDQRHLWNPHRRVHALRWDVFYTNFCLSLKIDKWLIFRWHGCLDCSLCISLWCLWLWHVPYCPWAFGIQPDLNQNIHQGEWFKSSNVTRLSAPTHWTRALAQRWSSCLDKYKAEFLLLSHRSLFHTKIKVQIQIQLLIQMQVQMKMKM